MPKVSVIIPVYNVEKYLKQCLDSVLNQTLEDIEIICVNDGSTDNCPQILEDYVRQDKRIKVIHKSNSGYGHSMNVGIDNATGEYIGIVESDDWILPDMYETLYSKAKENDLDVIKSDYFEYWGKFNCKNLIHYDNLEYQYNKILKDEDLEIFWKYIAFNWIGIYKRSFLNQNNIRHNESLGASYQDAGFRMQVTAMAKSGMIIDKAFYMYRQDNPYSSVKSKEKMMCIRNEYEYTAKILKAKNLNLSLKILYSYLILDHRWTLNRIDDSLKSQYIHIILNDYNNLKDNITWGKIQNSEIIEKWIKDFSQNWCEIYENYKKQKSIFINSILNIEKDKKIIIYGTGKIGNSTFWQLVRLGYLDRILFFAETNPEKNRKFYNFDVKSGKEICKYKDDVIVIVAVGKTTGAYHEVTKYLNNLGIKNYIDNKFLICNLYM